MPDPSTSNKDNKMVLLLLVNGFSPTELSASLTTLKGQTKNLGTHNQRDLYWQAYENVQKDVTKYASIEVDDGKLYGLIKYYAPTSNSSEDGDGNTAMRTEYEPFTKRQRALVQTPRVFMGRHIRLLVDDDENAGSGKEFFMPWMGDEAEAAYLDITSGEPVISLDLDRGVFVSTRIKRKQCANLPSTLKSMDALKEYIANSLKPDHPLQSIAWDGHHPPTVTSYNVLLTGVWPTTITHHLPDDLAAHTNTTSMHEIYDVFEQRRNTHYIQEAEVLIARMLVEIHKNAHDSSSSVHTGSMKDLVCAKRNALLKKVYIDASKTKFIENAKKHVADNAFEMIVVHSRPPEQAGKFEEYGGIVFETFYKLDLSIYS
jgi:hypothetical protein